MNGVNYYGSIDDVVHRYPWKFKLTSQRLFHSMAAQVIDGRPLLLNDGYLVNHPVARSAVLQKDNLLWALLEKGFVKLYVRGGENYNLQEMPERMSHVESFRDLVGDRVPGVSWRELRRKLASVDKRMRDHGALVSWPNYDTGSGFKVLVDRINAKESSARSLGLGFLVRNETLREFLKRFRDRLESDPRGPRDQWEKLAKQISEDRRYNVENPTQFVAKFMRLANEMYHYNQGVMLAATLNEPVSVETQTSAAFDDLLKIRDIGLEEVPSFPRLHVPLAVSHVHPSKIASFLDADSRIGRARLVWIETRESYWANPAGGREAAREAAKEYSSRIREAIGRDVRYEESENMIDFAVGSLAAGITELIYPGGIPALAVGYIMTKLQKRVTGVVTEKIRLRRFENDLMDEGLIRKSEHLIEKIKNRRVPSAIEIDRDAATMLSRDMVAFT